MAKQDAGLVAGDEFELVEAAEALGLTRVELQLPSESPTVRVWSATRLGEMAEEVHMQGLESRVLRLHAGPKELGSLRVLALDETEVMRPMGAALCQVLADGISHALLGMTVREAEGPDPSATAVRSG